MLGLVSTVAIAWGCAVLVHVPGDPYGSKPLPATFGWRVLLPHERIASGYADRGMSVTRWDLFGSTYFQTGVLTAAAIMPAGTPTPEAVAGSRLERIALPWTFGLRKWPPNDDRSYFSVRGWPMRALWCGYDETYPTGGLYATVVIDGGLRLPINDPKSVWYAAPPAPTALPYRPIWMGLAVDTMFFAGVWVVVLTGVPWVRRRMRRRRGACEGCGYGMEGLKAGAVCPECGRAGVRGEG